MAGFIDFHPHAFPDHIAPAAIASLEKEGKIKAYLDGTVSNLLASNFWSICRTSMTRDSSGSRCTPITS